MRSHSTIDLCIGLRIESENDSDNSSIPRAAIAKPSSGTP